MTGESIKKTSLHAPGTRSPTFYALPSSEANTDYADRSQDLAAKFTARSFRVVSGAINAM